MLLVLKSVNLCLIRVFSFLQILRVGSILCMTVEENKPSILRKEKVAVKKLGQFSVFDIERFLKDKKLMTTGVSPITDDDGKRIGTKVQVVILEDNTEYRVAEGEQVTNQFEKFNIKLNKVVDNVPMNAIVVPVNPVATVYGEFRNNISVTADGLKVIQRSE